MFVDVAQSKDLHRLIVTLSYDGSVMNEVKRKEIAVAEAIIHSHSLLLP